MVAPLPDACPPVDAQPPSGTFLRFVDAPDDTVTADSWLLPYENPNSPLFGQAEVCAHHAHSLLADPDDVTKARRAIPVFRKKRVVEVTLEPPMGMIKNTPSGRIGSSHHSWWPAEPGEPPESTLLP
jgi:hypothetical protein